MTWSPSPSSLGWEKKRAREAPYNDFNLDQQIATGLALLTKMEVMQARLAELVACPVPHGTVGRAICREVREKTYCLRALDAIQNQRMGSIERRLEWRDAHPRHP